MIRKFITLLVFVTTVTLAAFGQNVFGRNDLVKIAHQVQQDGPQKAQQVFAETDKLLANLAPQAGLDTHVCTFASIEDATRLYQ